MPTIRQVAFLSLALTAPNLLEAQTARYRRVRTFPPECWDKPTTNPLYNQSFPVEKVFLIKDEYEVLETCYPDNFLIDLSAERIRQLYRYDVLNETDGTLFTYRCDPTGSSRGIDARNFTGSCRNCDTYIYRDYPPRTTDKCSAAWYDIVDGIQPNSTLSPHHFSTSLHLSNDTTCSTAPLALTQHPYFASCTQLSSTIWSISNVTRNSTGADNVIRWACEDPKCEKCESIVREIEYVRNRTSGDYTPEWVINTPDRNGPVNPTPTTCVASPTSISTISQRATFTLRLSHWSIRDSSTNAKLDAPPPRGSDTKSLVPGSPNSNGSNGGSNNNNGAESQSKPNIPLIAGASAGAIVFIAILIGLIFFFIRRRRQNSSSTSYGKHDSNLRWSVPGVHRPPNHHVSLNSANDPYASNGSGASTGLAAPSRTGSTKGARAEHYELNEYEVPEVYYYDKKHGDGNGRVY
ncbi:hypothetical protein HK097_003571 [Rhizophlyctis rosea]|uniref:LPXTG-domain-containing protein n=1 Tax=Rhizophlyctis rosea TaxID=64517 RepID=A0AAD5X3T2_9FUNG|nr:hypothetical protein HK097_003571 [Rhizophlyctis rosea]